MILDVLFIVLLITVIWYLSSTEVCQKCFKTTFNKLRRKNPDPRRKSNSWNLLHTPSVGRMSPIIQELNSEWSSNLEPAARSVRGISGRFSSKEKHIHTDGMSTKSNLKWLSVNYKKHKKNAEKLSFGGNGELGRASGFEVPVNRYHAKITPPVSKPKSTRVIYHPPGQYGDHAFKKKGFGAHIMDLLDEDSTTLETDCGACLMKFETLKGISSPCKHRICALCIDRAIENFLNSNYQNHLICPVEFCQQVIDIELVKRHLDLLIFNIVKKELTKRQEQAYEKREGYLYQKISCLNCNKNATMDKKAIHFICRYCFKEFCSYCHKDWPGINSHVECRLLNCSGNKCFQELHVAPDNWEESNSEVTPEKNKLKSVAKTSLVNLFGHEGRAIISLFIQTSPDFWITKIIRLQNLKLWEKYVLTRKQMVDEIGVSNINERALFHGTNEKNISLISEEGFDMRIETANGNLFGKGTYFSTTSSFSQVYAGSSNKMFIARVLCGHSTIGQSEYKRPPKDKSGRMYDSCVNNDSTIYCLFDNSQYYPAYIIEYTEKDKIIH